jgi:hypothetical protein
MALLTDEQIKECFKEHKPEYRQIEENTERLIWQKPETNIDRIDYLRDREALFIKGNVGKAVFKWSYPISLKGISGCNINYFMEKCQASECGRNWREWDEETAKKAIVEHFREYGKRELFRTFREDRGFEYIDSRESWVEWIRNHDLGIEYFGQDTWEWIYKIGDVFPVRARAWLIGLKMAIEVLDTEAKLRS